MTNWVGEKYNYVYEVIMDGCDAPLTAIAATALPAALRAVATYYCPDPVQMFTGYVRPGTPFKGRRKGGHAAGSRSGSKGNKYWRGFKKAFGFDPNEWLAKKMPFAEDMEGRRVPGGARYGWAFFGGIERFNNWMFMYELTENFFYQWAAGIAETQYCQNQRAAVFFGSSERQAHFGPLGETPCVIETVHKQRKVSFIGGNVVAPLTRRFQASMSVGSIVPWIDDGDITQVKLIVKIEGQPPLEQHLDGDGKAQMAWTMQNDGGYVAFFLGGPFSYWANDVQFSVYGYEDVPETRPMDWCGKLADQAINWATRT